MKNHSKKFPMGSVMYVAAHCAYRESRGRKPSASYQGIKNPRMALQKARQILEDENFQEALSWLKHIRSGRSGSDAQAPDWIREYCEEAGCTLEDIGTSDAELQTLKRNGYKKDALSWLEHIRSGRSGSEAQAPDWIREFCEKAGCTLADIGTNDAELQTLKRDGYKKDAMTWLEIIRSGRSGNEAQAPDWIREFCEKAGCSLEDIGTSDAELQTLKRAGYKKDAITWLEIIRSGRSGCANQATDWIKKFCEKAGCTLADIGTSDTELQSLI